VSNANAGFDARFSGKSARLGLGNVLAGPRRWALSAAVAGLVTFGCGTPATLYISAPSSAVAGSPFTVTVTATVGGSPDKVINSPIQFTSSDSAAVLPGYYYFTANDAGSHTFTNGVTLMTAGSQSITATVIGASALTATANVTVSATTTATQFKVSAPSTRTAGSAFSTKVSVEDANGNVVTGYTGTVHFTSSDTPARIEEEQQVASQKELPEESTN
jgi:hypothetical protein